MQEELKNLSHTEPMSTCSQEWVAQVQAHFGKEGMISNFYNAGLTSRTRLFLTLQDEGIFATSIELMKITSEPQDGVLTGVEVMMEKVGTPYYLPSILASVLFTLCEKRESPIEGMILENLVGDYIAGTELPDVLFTRTLVHPELSRVKLSDRYVVSLAAIPVSKAEGALVVKEGLPKLLGIWSGKGVDSTDWERRSSV